VVDAVVAAAGTKRTVTKVLLLCCTEKTGRKEIMIGQRTITLKSLWVTSALLLLGIASVAVVSAQTLGTKVFQTPQAAVQSVTAATAAKDRAALQEIFGPDLKNLLSGDEVADHNTFDEFAKYVAEATKIEKETDAKMTLLVGNEEWPFPIPIVKNGSGWSFDTKAGTEEVFNRRIGGNEADAILVAQAYAIAQWEYFDGDDRDHDQVSEYAQKLLSSPGKQDGLYWETIADDEPSPLGPLIAMARKEGYTRKNEGATTQSASPFHGYYFKILTSGKKRSRRSLQLSHQWQHDSRLCLGRLSGHVG
jgi:hypothetical protein